MFQIDWIVLSFLAVIRLSSARLSTQPGNPSHSSFGILPHYFALASFPSLDFRVTISARFSHRCHLSGLRSELNLGQSDVFLRRRSHLGTALHPLLHLRGELVRVCTDHLVDSFSILEEQEGRHGSDT